LRDINAVDCRQRPGRIDMSAFGYEQTFPLQLIVRDQFEIDLNLRVIAKVRRG